MRRTLQRAAACRSLMPDSRRQRFAVETQAGSGGTLAGGAALFSAFALKNRMRGTGRSPDPAGALPAAPREGTSSLSKPILGSSCGWNGSFQRFCAEKSHGGTGRSPDPAGALPAALREGTSSLSKPILGYSCGWSGSFQRFCAEKSHGRTGRSPDPARALPTAPREGTSSLSKPILDEERSFFDAEENCILYHQP